MLIRIFIACSYTMQHFDSPVLYYSNGGGYVLKESSFRRISSSISSASATSTPCLSQDFPADIMCFPLFPAMQDLIFVCRKFRHLQEKTKITSKKTDETFSKALKFLLETPRFTPFAFQHLSIHPSKFIETQVFSVSRQ